MCATKTRLIGRWAEDVAASYLQAKKLEIIARNFHSRYGEIDLICLEHLDDGTFLCFIEVKARQISHYAAASESIDPRKQHKIIQTAQVFLTKFPQYENLFCRFDAFTLEYHQVDVLDLNIEKTINHPAIQLQWIKHAYTL